MISLDDVLVPATNLLGAEHEGFKLIMANFQWERLVMALQAVGTMADALERTLAFARDGSIGRRQAIRHRLADLATSLHGCRCVTYDALSRYAAGHDVTREVTMAKLLTQRAAFDLTDACLQIHGAAGYLCEVGIERMVRDARLGPIGGGTDEIMRELLGKSLLTVLPPAGAVHAGQAS